MSNRRRRRRYNDDVIDVGEAYDVTDIEGDDDWYEFEDEIAPHTEAEKNLLRVGYMHGRYIDGLEVRLEKRGDHLIAKSSQSINLTNLFQALLQVWMSFIEAGRKAYHESEQNHRNDRRYYDDDY
jgi:hypothetical protein